MHACKAMQRSAANRLRWPLLLLLLWSPGLVTVDCKAPPSETAETLPSDLFLRCSWTNPADPYLAALGMYNRFMKDYFARPPNVHCDDGDPPHCEALKKLVAGEQSTVIAHFYAHALTLCNLERLHDWTKGNLRKATTLLNGRNDLLKNTKTLAQDMKKLAATQAHVNQLMNEDLKFVSTYERTLKMHETAISELTSSLLKLRDITVGLITMGFWWFYIFAVIFLKAAGRYRLPVLIGAFGLFCIAEVARQRDLICLPVYVFPKDIQVEVIRMLSCLCCAALLCFSGFAIPSDPREEAMEKSIVEVEDTREFLRHL